MTISNSPQTPEYAEGQVWSYRTRATESDSRLLINKVENHPKLGKIFHISLLNVRLKNPKTPGGITQDLPHSPVSKQTLDKSCVKLVGHSKINPSYLDGYNEWRKEFDAGRAGIFTISASEIIEVIEKAIASD